MDLKQRLAVAALAAGVSGCANTYDTVTPELQASMLADLRAGSASGGASSSKGAGWVAPPPAASGGSDSAGSAAPPPPSAH